MANAKILLFLLALLVSLPPAHIFGKDGAKAETEAKEETKKVSLLIIGDSLSAGYKVDEQKSYPKLLESLLKKRHPTYTTEIINLSISGSTSASAKSRLKRSSPKYAPDVLLIALGGNDGLRGLPASAMKKNLQETIDLGQSMGLEIILAGMKVPANYGKRYQEQFDKAFEELAQKNDLVFIPFLLKGVAMNPKLNLPDGIHPNEEGQKMMAETVLPYLEKFYK